MKYLSFECNRLTDIKGFWSFKIDKLRYHVPRQKSSDFYSYCYMGQSIQEWTK